MKNKLDIKNIVLIGRTFEEYYKMFNLNTVGKNEKILDVASGVCSFGAEARHDGYNVISSDRVYCFSPEEIEKKCEADLQLTMEKLEDIKGLYKWEQFKNVEDLVNERRKAYRTFVEDFKNNPNCYINTNYPKNNFENNQFDITLVSHFLFMYDEQLDYDFHKEVIKELIRITSKEIRLFPLVNLKCEKSFFLEKLINDEEFKSLKFEISKVDYEFIKGGNEMLVIRL